MVGVSKNFILISLFQVWCYKNWKSFPRNDNSAIAGLEYNTGLMCYPLIQLGSTYKGWSDLCTYLGFHLCILNDKTLNENHVEKFVNYHTVQEIYLLQWNQIDPVSGEELNSSDLGPYATAAWPQRRWRRGGSGDGGKLLIGLRNWELRMFPAESD